MLVKETGVIRNYSIAAIIIIVVSILVYSNTLNGRFVWDDRGSIVFNTSLRTINNIPLFFLTDQWKLTGNPSSNYYRPVINTFWALEFQLWGENPRGYHVTNILLHALLSFLFFNLCLKILGSDAASFFSALIFAAHPIHTECVAWITGVGYIIFSIFIVLSLLFYIRFTDNQSGTSLILSISSFTLAVFSIEYALMFPFIIIAYEHLFKRRMVRVKIILPFILIPILYLVAREFIVVSGNSSEMPLYSRILTSVVIQVKYLYIFFLPYALNVLYDIRSVSTVVSAEVILSVFVLIAVAALMFYLYRHEKRAFFALFWFFIILFPAANIIVVLKPQVMSLRYLYIPSIGLAMFSGIYIEKFYSRLKIIPVLIIMLLSLKTFTQNRYWHDEITLYGKMVSDAPASALARNNLGVAYLEANMPLNALLEFQKAVQIDPSYGFAVFNLGDTYQSFNKFNEAIFYLQKAIRINPSDSRTYNSLGIVYKKTGRYQEALDEFNLSLLANPNNYEAHYNLAELLSFLGRKKEAVVHYMEFVRLAPARYNALKQPIGQMLRETGVILN